MSKIGDLDKFSRNLYKLSPIFRHTFVLIKSVMTEKKLNMGKVEETVVNAYKKVENAVVGTYQKIEDSVVNTYQKVEDAFVDKFLEEVPEDEELSKKEAN